VPDIDPEQDYPFPLAARLISSPLTRSGHIHLSTLHGWRRHGLVQARQRQVGGRAYWLLSGSELLRLLRARTHRRPLGGEPQQDG
jgi:hypothetical protein